MLRRRLAVSQAAISGAGGFPRTVGVSSLASDASEGTAARTGEVMRRSYELFRESLIVSARQLGEHFRQSGASGEDKGDKGTNSSKPSDGGKKRSGNGGGGSGGGDDMNIDTADDLTPKIKLFVFGMFVVSIALYKLAMPRGKHVGWATIFETYAEDKVLSVDVYDRYAEFSTNEGYLHVGLVDDQHTNAKIRGMSAYRQKRALAKLEAAGEAGKEQIASEVKAGKGSAEFSHCGTPTAQMMLTAFGVFAWIVPFVFFPTVALILTRAVGTAMAVSAAGESKSKILKKEFIVHTTSATRFSQVAGMKEAKREVTEIVEFLKNPTKYTRLGAKIPTGALLMGPPGTGKTLLAKAVAGEAGIGFIPVCGSDFVELYVGMGALRVRQLFEVAKQQRCIVYIDEIDAIGLKRQGSGNGEKQEQEHTLNELLTQLDGFSSNRGEIMILASTNVAQEALDPALIRPGRFDRLVHVDAPVISERIDIFKVHLANLTLVERPASASDTVAAADVKETPVEATESKSDKTPENAEKVETTPAGDVVVKAVAPVPMHKILAVNERLLASRVVDSLTLSHSIRHVANSVVQLLILISTRALPASIDSAAAKLMSPDNKGQDSVSAGDISTLESIVLQSKANLNPSETELRALQTACLSSRRFLRLIAKSDDVGIPPQELLAFLQRELYRNVDVVIEQIIAVDQAVTAAFPPPTPKGSTEAPVSRFHRQIELLRNNAESYKNTISQIRLSAPVQAPADGSSSSSDANDADASQKRRLAAALYSALEDQADRVLEITVPLMLMRSSAAKLSGDTTAADALREKFMAQLLQLGQIVLQPPGYELLTPKTGDATAAPQSTPQEVEKKATVQQAYEFDFTSILAQKTKEEQRLIDEYSKRMSDLCPGFVGADIANVCNEGAILAAREKCSTVTISHLERSIDRVLAGIEHRSRRLSDFEKKVVAHHEAGHAVAGWFLNLADPLMKVSIVPRGGSALGYAQYLPNENHLRTASEVLDSVCVTLGGRVAEQIFFNHLSTGASDDLQKVTKMIYMYVSSFTSSTVRPSPTSDQTKFVKPFGANMSNNLDEKAKELVDQLYARTFDLLTSKKAEMELLANHLLEHEVLTHADVVRLIGTRQERQADRKRAV